MSISYYQANKNLDRQFGGTSNTVSTTFYIGLSTTTISADGTGITEPSGGSYARVSVANNKTTWDTAASGILSNLINFQFTESTASWGTITDVFISDAASAGNLLYYGVLSAPRTVADATTVLFAPGGFVVKENNT